MSVWYAVICSRCRRRSSVDVIEARHTNAWPKCCGQTMDVMADTEQRTHRRAADPFESRCLDQGNEAA
jgi:hypothetical protein